MNTKQAADLVIEIAVRSMVASMREEGIGETTIDKIITRSDKKATALLKKFLKLNHEKS